MGVLEQLQSMGRTPGELSPDAFDASTNVTGEESRVLRRQADAVFALVNGPVKLALPAYEQFTSDGTAGNTETFTLSASVVESPDTQDVVVWLDGDYYGHPDATDYTANTIDVTDAGTDSTVHVYHISDEPATLRFYRSWPGGNDRDPLETYNMGLVHQGNQSEDPEDFSVSGLERFIAEDMTLDVTVDAPYTVRYREETDETFATNALLQIDVQEGGGSIDGLSEALYDRRGR